MEVALLGPKGTYTHQAAKKYFKNIDPIFKSSIKKVFNSDSTYKLVPVENSLQGDVSETIDLLRDENCQIVGEKIIKIEHCLLSDESSLKNIEKVYSHPQALGQCSKYIEKHELATVETNSTAKATEKVQKGEAAIASKIAGEINGKNILEESIQDADNNYTRFLVISDRTNKEERKNKTSLIIEPEEDRPGILSSILACFSGHGINLSHIQSRPTKQELGKYFFYIEAEASQNNTSMKKAIKCSSTYAKTKVLGSYKTDKGR